MTTYTSSIPLVSGDGLQRGEALRCATDVVTAKIAAGQSYDDVIDLAEKMAEFLAGHSSAGV